MDDSPETMELALFPLDTVLFPGQLLPLHIFENRYRLMVRRCLAEDLPFGVVLIRRGLEGGERAEPHSVGTVARIIESTNLPDGSMNIVTVGTERFRILRLLHGQPYLRGEVVAFPLPEPPDLATVADLTRWVREQVTKYIELIATVAGLRIQVSDMPESPRQVGYLAAVALQIENEEKQSLLNSRSVQSILSAEVNLLRRENALLGWMVSHKEWPGQAQFGPGGTLLPN